MATPSLPQLDGDRLYITDGGLETVLIFKRGIDLPEFAAFPLVEDERGREALRDYFGSYIELARAHGAGLVLDTPTWRANRDWGERLGYPAERLREANANAVAFAQSLRDANPDVAMVVNGVTGPRGDGYVPGATMSADDAEAYHAAQIMAFAEAGADMATAVTMNYAAEAVGVARAALAAGIPVAISFTVETDGRLPTGQELGDAIGEVDAATRGEVAYYMVNCAHPTHFEHVLQGSWTERVVGLRANASRMSHAELDAAEELDDGDPEELGEQYRALRERLPRLNVVGGCCGTDDRHVGAAVRCLTEAGQA